MAIKNTEDLTTQLTGADMEGMVVMDTVVMVGMGAMEVMVITVPHIATSQ